MERRDLLKLGALGAVATFTAGCASSQNQIIVNKEVATSLKGKKRVIKKGLLTTAPVPRHAIIHFTQTRSLGTGPLKVTQPDWSKAPISRRQTIACSLGEPAPRGSRRPARGVIRNESVKDPGRVSYAEFPFEGRRSERRSPAPI